ncbi:MAG: ABC transporter ATP-binding protein [Chitinophagaceae bacterium]|nr:ABC transporter ATP-binding protein [Rubrivivax sp.]
MVEIRDLCVQFGGVKPIDGLSATLSAPIVGLIGPNGAGKTTLLNVFSGFVTPARGSVKVAGVELVGMPPHRRAQLGLRRTFQTDQIAEDLTLWDNVKAAADHVALDESVASAVGRAIAYVGLSHRARDRGDQLTTHDRHLAEIAKALVGRPTLVMMDEPGAGLSESESEHLKTIILGVPAYCGAQVLLIDHDVALIAACCEVCMVLDFGKLLATGPTVEVLSLPEVRRAYLGEAAQDAVEPLEQAA